MDKFFDYAFANNLAKRDRIMAECSLSFLVTSKDLLIVCGEKHLEGIVENLSAKLNLEEIRSVQLN